MLTIYFIKDFPGIDNFIKLSIYRDPVIVGFISIGISMILEKNHEVLPALFVTPLNHHISDSRIIMLSAIGFSGALAILIDGKRNFV